LISYARRYRLTVLVNWPPPSCRLSNLKNTRCLPPEHIRINGQDRLRYMRIFSTMEVVV
jgi:hypothetical protein